MIEAIDPRVARTKALVLQVAGELLAEHGREGFTIDAVAKHSGVARTTIYRHWPELADLLFDTMRAMGNPPQRPDTGSLRDDLVSIYAALSEGFETSCVGRAMPVLLDITRRDPALHGFYRAFVAERRQPSLDAVAAGVERGELPADIDRERLVDRIAGPVFYRHLVVQDPYTRADVERLVDEVLSGELPRRASRGRARATG